MASYSHAPAVLSSDEVRTYHDDGFVVLWFQLDADTVMAMREALHDLVAAYPHITTEGLVSPPIRYAGTRHPDVHDRYLGFCRIPAILDIVEQLIGRDIILWATRVFSKGSIRDS